MNRRALLKLGALAAVAPRAMAAAPAVPAVPSEMQAYIESLYARAFEAAGINGPWTPGDWAFFIGDRDDRAVP